MALAQAAFVTFLWSTSWILIKFGLENLNLAPLTFAGLRYVLASLLLLPLALPAFLRAKAVPVQERRRVLGWTALLGVILYAVTQGAQFAALVHLPSVAVALALSTTPVIVALTTLRAGERPTLMQAGGAVALVVGAAIYYGPIALGPEAIVGLAIIAVGVVSNAASAVLGRTLARDSLPVLGGVVVLTAFSMAVGSVVLLAVGIAIEGWPSLQGDSLLILGWLAVVNTAFAFTIWNLTLKTLTAVESSVLNNLMLVQIAVLAWFLLGEKFDARQMIGLAVALAGIVVVQLRAPSRMTPVAQATDEASDA